MNLEDLVLPNLEKRTPILVVGAAPCLENHPKRWLKKFITIGVNCSCYYFDPTYLLWSDTLVAEERSHQRAVMAYDGTLLVNNSIYSIFQARKGGPTISFQPYHNGRELEEPFSGGPNHLTGNFSVTQLAVQLASRMNPSGIYTVGVEYLSTDNSCGDRHGRPEVFGVQKLQPEMDHPPIHDLSLVLATHKKQGEVLLDMGIDVGTLDETSRLPNPPWKKVSWDYVRSFQEVTLA